MTKVIKGLVLAGGRSRRMGQDKTAINYQGISQVDYLYNLLGQNLDEVYVSCRQEQSLEPHLVGKNQIHDAHGDIGPIGAILSAMDRDPEAAWLVVACDMPYIDQQSVRQLIKKRDSQKVATCFRNPDRGWAEPLFTIWEPKSKEAFIEFLEKGYKCPRKVLMNTDTHIIDPHNAKALENINTPEELRVLQENDFKSEVRL